AFDGRLIAVDEFHHVSANPDNRLGAQLGQLIARDKVHLVAMTGSYFRGDSVAVLTPEDEARFVTVSYTYYEQLNGYQWLKTLDIAYSFYTGRYVDKINTLLDPAVKTIVHIPSVNSRESTKDKHREVEEIMDHLGKWKGTDQATGFHLIETADGRTIKVADLVDDDPVRRDRVAAALKSPAARTDRDHVDIIIALGMAKEGFDWIWCEHALTVGYRSSLTEIIQIIGRATRDAPGKTVARFTNLIAEPAAADDVVAEAVNDTLKAIAASLLMEQVLAPRFEFTPKDAGPKDGYDYGPDGYVEGRTNVGFNEERGQFHFELKDLVQPTTPEARRVCEQDINEVITSFIQDKQAIERGMFDPEVVPEELTQVRMGKIVRDRYPEMSETDQEAIRQHAIAALNITQQAAKIVTETATEDASGELQANTTFVDGVRKFMNVRELDIDLIDRINPFDAAYAILAKAMNECTLRQVQAAISARKATLTEDEARAFAVRAVQWKRERGRAPEATSQDPWERQLAEGVAAFARFRQKAAAANG
ncbi:DEAD/DEAH box helicase, partial [uncultured Sphingomonas sp.]|uniref:DEAD/DEAH box helicase n=1 Tax=uncultured Sphingomonas sp. TaxID=158754 RepID=UPI0035CB8853